MLGWLRSLLSVRVPERFTLREMAYVLDGGTTSLMGTDEHGGPVSITLSQHQISWVPGRPPPRGRLYINGRKVAVRSDPERAIIALVERAVEELKQAPSEEMPIGTEQPQERQDVVISFSADLRELAGLRGRSRLIWGAEQILNYVRSHEYANGE
jgi:hypothetical protein